MVVVMFFRHVNDLTNTISHVMKILKKGISTKVHESVRFVVQNEKAYVRDLMIIIVIVGAELKDRLPTASPNHYSSKPMQC